MVNKLLFSIVTKQVKTWSPLPAYRQDIANYHSDRIFATKSDVSAGLTYPK